MAGRLRFGDIIKPSPGGTPEMRAIYVRTKSKRTWLAVMLHYPAFPEDHHAFEANRDYWKIDEDWPDGASR